MSEYPSKGKQLQNLISMIQDTIMDVVSGNDVFVSEEQKERRMNTCKACEFYDPEQVRCKDCGCFLENKVTFTSASCPRNYWPNEE